MYKSHIFVSCFNLLCALTLLVLFFVIPPNGESYLLAFALIGGYIGNVVALGVAVILLVLIACRAFTKKVQASISNHWLGLLNGFVVITFWGVIFSN